MRTLALLWLVLAPCGPPALLAEGGCLELYPSAVVRIYDGDTLTVEIPGWPPIFRKISVRLTGYDTPEIRGRCDRERELALLAKAALIGAIRNARTVRLEDIETGKYFRLTAELSTDGVPVAAHLIEAGLARPYDGGTREGWCP